MAVQEALIWTPHHVLIGPGVLFDAPFAGKDGDLTHWKEARTVMWDCLRNGIYIMCIVQTRNTRDWDARLKQFRFSSGPNGEDYIIAAFAVPGNLGQPYTPARVLGRFLELSLSTPGPLDLGDGIRSVFRSDPAASRLTINGFQQMSEQFPAQNQIRNFTRNGQSGWQGGNFPPISHDRGNFIGNSRINP
ncbi:hypothetical protein CKO09_03720 [Chromatium weissei]|nr:hypothetical protein [Chromatium weissei]